MSRVFLWPTKLEQVFLYVWGEDGRGLDGLEFHDGVLLAGTGQQVQRKPRHLQQHLERTFFPYDLAQTALPLVWELRVVVELFLVLLPRLCHGGMETSGEVV